MSMPSKSRFPSLLLAAALCFLSLGHADAEGIRIENKVAVFSALDKVTARISTIKIPLNETYLFGSLKVTPRVCYSRPATERPKTSTFVEIKEVQLDGQEEKLFAGWMFAESPALNAVEHPVFDVWLSGCEGGTAPDTPRPSTTTANKGDTPVPPTPRRRRRIRR